MSSFDATTEPAFRLLYKPLDNAETAGCHMDVYTPAKRDGPEGYPVAIFIHGGAFTQGSSRDVAANQIAYLTSKHVLCVSLEYRLAPHATLKQMREDLCDAYLYIQDRLQTDLEKEGLDVAIRQDRCLVTGGSAGGTSSIYMAADIERLRQDRSDLPPLRAVMPAFPLVDWEAEAGNSKPRSALQEEWADRKEWDVIKATFDQPVCCSDPYPADVFNPDLSQPRLMFIRAASESKTLNSFVIGHDQPYPPEASILGSISPGFPPTRVFCAVKDSLIPVEHSYRLVKHLQAKDVDAQEVVVEEAEHGFTDLPVRYFPDHAEKWWNESIRPTLEWGIVQLEQ